MTGFRLVEYGGGGRGPVTLPHVYDSVLDAVEAAEIMLTALADHPHRRPFRVDVYDVWTRETVSSVRLDVPRDPNLCPVCHQPNDPFAGVEQGVARPPSGATPPPHPARGHVGTEATDNVLASSQKRETDLSPLPDASEWQIRPARRPGGDE